jgi:hypothetical protein
MWFDLLLRGFRADHRPARRMPASRRLGLEALEDRTVPSAISPVKQPDNAAGIVSSLADHQTQSFSASGTFAHTDNKVGTISGKATPLGSFTGTFTQNSNGVGNQTGTFTMAFGSGSLTCSYQVSLDRATNEFVGTWQITGGTGALADASGGGSITIDHAASGNVSLSGTISQ